MTKQVFINEVKGNFNLRRPKSKKPTNIYFVVYMFGKQNYFATGLKIYPEQWDIERQQAIISNRQTKLDNRNNELLNKKLSLYNSYLSEYKSYICENPEELEKGALLLKSFIYKDMKKDKASDIVKKAFDYYYYTLNSNVTDSTRKTAKSLLDAYLEYLSKTKDSIDVLNQKGLNDYQDYLMKEIKEKGNSGVVRINKKCQLLERLINKVIVVRNEYLKYKLQPVKYVLLKDTRKREDINRFPLEENEIEAIKEVKLDEKLNEFRDIFLLQISCGQRVSDLCKLINKEYTEQEDYYIIKTQKETTKAFIEKSKVIDDFFSKYEKGLKYAHYKGDKIALNSDGNQYNKAIRKICELAKLDREMEYIDSKGRERKEPLYKVIVNHDARHTFITIKLREGMLPNELCELSGHADDEMINSVYGHLTSTDKIKKLEKAKKRIEENKTINNNINTNISSEIVELIRKDERNRLKDKLGGKDLERNLMKFYAEIAKGEIKINAKNIGYIKELIKRGMIKPIRDKKKIGNKIVEYDRYEIV